MTHDLQTLAERSDYQRTGRTDEVERLCAAFSERWPDAVRVIEFGRSSEGRPMRSLLATRCGQLDAPGLRAACVPLLFVQAGIHPGESDGKDAGFIALRELLQGDVLPDALRDVAILFVPAFNVDGHERMGRWNRPNQNGPEETGWRVTARNVNLNRDYCKAETVEMRSLLRLITQWDPLICADLHVTDGADFQPDISVQAEPINQGDPALYAAATALRDQVIDRLRAQGSKPLSFYPDFYVTDDPSSGFVLTVYSPRFSTGYFAQRNRFTLLVETHSWKDYRTRVRVTRNTLINTVEALVEHGPAWLQQVRAADQAAARIAGTEQVLDYRSGWREPGKAGSTGKDNSDAGAAASARMIDFPGYAYTRTQSAVSGTLFTAYDPQTPQIWRVPYRDRVEPSIVVRAPCGGYVVPTAYAPDLSGKLIVHGIAFELLPDAIEGFEAEHFRASSVEYSPVPFEGRMRARLTGAWSARSQTLTAGSLYVPLAQPLSRLILALLEPQAPDSFAAWGFFNACFEQKEQLEPYVAEQIAHNMLNENAGLAAEFRRKLQHDTAFAGDPTARLEYFLRRHNSWDERHNLYPIYRVTSHPGRR
jgi:murein tripeptide amidase MpaA